MLPPFALTLALLSRYQGVGCGTCAKGYYNRGYYSQDLSKCRPCSSSVGASGLFWSFIFFILLLVVLRVAFVRTFGMLAWHEVTRRMRLTTGKLRIMFMSMQTLTQTTGGIFALCPPSFVQFNLVASYVVNFEILEIAPLQCYGSRDMSPFYQRVLFYTLTPISLGVLTLVAFFALSHTRMCDHRKRQRWFANVAYLGLLFLYIIIVPTSATVLKVFTCEKVAPNLWFLTDDLSVRCYTRVHTAWMLFAAVMTLVFPIGVRKMESLLLLML